MKDELDLDYWRILSLLFKISWIIAALYSIYFIFGTMFLGYIFQFENAKPERTVLNFVLPSLVGILSIILFSKELIFGYFTEYYKRSLISLAIISILIIVSSIPLIDYYSWFLEDIDSTFGVGIPLLILFASFLGLILNRAYYLIRKQNK